MDLQSEEILYANNELEKKFRALEDTIERLSLLIDLSAAVNATLDPEKIYEQAVERLVNPMGYEYTHAVLSREGLEECACECYATIREETDRLMGTG